MVLVDTNVLLDVVQDDPVWAEWSQGQLDAWAAVMELPLLTRETARYRTYFPGIALITPEV